MSEILSKKKLIALIIVVALVAIAAFMLMPSNEEEDEIKGAEVQMYLTTLPQTIDPSASYTSAEQVRIMGLIYEGLTSINEDGDLENALCKEYEYEFDLRTGNLVLFITLEDSRWSDGNMVKSDDFRYAWKRLLLPESDNANAALLYPILNAQNVKEGLCSEDALGVYAPKNNLLQITFEKSFCNEDDFTDAEVEAKIEYFMRRLSSPALVPLRQDVVDEVTGTWCAPNGTGYVTNGPFKIRNWNTGELTFERNINYRCVGDTDGADDKIVKPFKLITLYAEGTTSDKHYERFGKDECFYLNLVTASKKTIDAVEDDIESTNLLSTTSLYLDTNHELFANPKVREAISLAFNRDKMAKDTLSNPATGFVPSGVENASGDDFREAGGDIISSKPNVKKAKELLKEAGIDPSKETIAIDYSSDSAADKLLAEACKAALNEIGFTRVTVNAKTQKFINSKESGEYPMNQTYEANNAASAIIVNVQSVTPDAYSILTSFSSKYGGTPIDITNPEITYGAHVTGFKDEKYDELCGGFVDATTEGYRNAIMHKAEEYLAKQLPAIPLVFNVANYVTKDIDNYEVDGYGRLNFTELKQDNFEDYIEKKD